MNYQQHNNLLKRYGEINAMRGIQVNPLLSNSSKVIQQPKQINDPRKIREVILDQRKVDSKIDVSKFNRIVANLDRTSNVDREKLWATRTNQPYKNILPVSEIKKEYKTKEELVVYRVKQEDKNEKKFAENAENMKKSIEQHNKELADKYASVKMGEHKKEFEYNHIEKYTVKYNPNDYNDMKNNLVDYYKKEQYEQEKDKKCVDDIIEGMMTSGINDDIEPRIENKPDEKNVSTDKYLQRQKKV